MGMLKDKRFRYGTFSTAMMIIAVGLFILINLVAGEFNRSYDLTAEQIFTLTSHTRNFLADLDQDVTLTHVTQVGQEHPVVAQLLEEYAAASRHITIETRDPIINPAIIHEFALAAGLEGGISDGSVVVQSATGTRVLSPIEMVTFDFNQWGQPVGIRSFNYESEITRAIHTLTQGDPPIIYFVTGSGEPPMEPGLHRLLEQENFVIREVNLVLEEVPDTADILFIKMPTRDWTPGKADRIEAFLDDEGRAFMALNFFPETFPNLNRVLAAYGIAMGESHIVEGNSSHMLFNPFNIVPLMNSSHTIFEMAAARSVHNLLQGAVAIETLDDRRIHTEIDPLMRTSNDAFVRVGHETFSQGPDDISGPFDLAVAITDSRFVDRLYFTRIVVVGNLGIVSDVVDSTIGGGNYQFVVSSLRWLQGRSPGIFIPVRQPPGVGRVMLTQFQASVMNGIAMGVLPAATLGLGLLIFLRRRHN